MQNPNSGLGGLNNQQYEPSLAESNVRSVISHTSFDHLLKQFKQYQPHSNIDFQNLKNSSSLKLKKFKQSAYYGQIVNGKRHGLGIMMYNNDRIYEGAWQNDYKYGYGYQLFPNGSVYEGQYLNGKPEGVGKYKWANGQSYQGEWLNGLKHGSGMWLGAKGDSYVGEWRMGKAQGYGVHVWVNGDRYQGQFKNCLKHGQGTQRFANGDLYKGEYSKGKPNGYGEYYWSNGSYFKGTFKDGLRQGHGMWKKGSGTSDKYEGQYVADKKHGYGIFSWASGNIYKGNYEEDLRTGYGQMYWQDGSYYKGSWMKGIQHGEGIIFMPGQGLKKGYFKDNVLVELVEEQNDPSPMPASMGKAGTIHKTSLVPPLPNKGSRNNANFRSIENKRRVVSVHNHPQTQKTQKTVHNSRELHPLIPRGDKKVNKTTGLVEIQKEPVSNINARSRDRIPHSAFYMHKLHKRVSTASNQQKGQFSHNRSRAEIVDQLRNFTKKIGNNQRM